MHLFFPVNAAQDDVAHGYNETLYQLQSLHGAGVAVQYGERDVRCETPADREEGFNPCNKGRKRDVKIQVVNTQDSRLASYIFNPINPDKI